MHNARGNREKALALVEDGLVDAYTMLVSCLMCMSEDEVGDMLHCEGYDADADDDDADDDADDDNDDDDNDGVEK